MADESKFKGNLMDDLTKTLVNWAVENQDNEESWAHLLWVLAKLGGISVGKFCHDIGNQTVNEELAAEYIKVFTEHADFAVKMEVTKDADTSRIN